MQRDFWQRRIASLDPDEDCVEIYRITAGCEFPWDMTQALSLALYRTYAVPSIGELLARTGELTGRTHKRYADTGLILDAILEHGFTSPTGRAALRRMNQMHNAYGISNDDMRYVLSTFVVVPMRWMDRFGWRPFGEAERRASANYYRELGRHMNIKDIPSTHQEFAACLDAYEAAHFGYSAGGRAVADATLSLFTSFQPRVAHGVARRASLALLDPPLLRAFGYPEPGRVLRAVVEGALRGRALVERFMPPRRTLRHVREMRDFAIYPEGYRVEELGTFPG